MNDVILSELRQRDEARILCVRAGERLPRDAFAEDVDEEVVPPDPCAFKDDEVPHLEHTNRADADLRFLEGLPRRSGLDGLPDLQQAAGQAPATRIRNGPPLDEQNGSVPERDRAHCGNRAIGELVVPRHGNPRGVSLYQSYAVRARSRSVSKRL